MFGSDTVEADAEVVSLAYNAYRLLGLDDVKIQLNTLGDTESRNNYREALIKYFEPHINDLCEDCQERFKKNPLRILDCKVDAGSEIIENAPKTIDYLNEESKKRFERLQELLDLMDIPYDVNTKLVRGLDYYNHMVFEVTLRDSYALGGGGRYNGLVETLGGPSVPGVGFAMGYDRTLLAMEEEGVNVPINNSVDVYLLAVSESERETAQYLAQELRLNGFIVETDLMGKALKGQFKSVDRFNSKYLIVLNDEDLSKNEVVLKDNKTKEEERMSITEIIEFLDTHM
jgi:histidyl-tRNA synthetase